MSRLLDDENDLLPQRDRELTLSTGSILGIFLGLVLLCAVFFGFGYNLGRKSAVTVPSATTTSPDEAAQPTAAPGSNPFSDFKTAPSSPAAAPAAATGTAAVPAAPASETSSTSLASTPPPATPAPVTHPASARRPPAAISPKAAALTPAASNHAATASSLPAVAPKGAFVVQVAAVSRKDDADLLVGALRAKGYPVAERTEPQDKLIHIQVGPYATRTDAEAMREKLVLDGYNAIVK